MRRYHPCHEGELPVDVIWRRRLIIISIFLVFTVTTAVISKLLDKVYETHATLLVTLPADSQSFDSVQASQAWRARTATSSSRRTSRSW